MTIRGLRDLFRRRGNHRNEIDEEIESHLRMAVQDRIEGGVSPEEARFSALREFGNVGLVKESTRSVWGRTAVEQLFRNICSGIRTLWKAPGFTAVAVLTLAFGIGGTTAIFTLIDAVMFRPLPVSDPGRLYRVGDGDDTNAVGREGEWGFFSIALYERLKAAAPEFEDIAAFDWGGNTFSVRRQGAVDGGRPLNGEYATGSYFSTLGVGALRGRVFGPDDDRPSAPPVVVLSYYAWQSIYGADPSIVGSTLVVQGRPFTVVGVTAPGFSGEVVRAYRPDIWIPLQQVALIDGAGSVKIQPTAAWLVVIGRLRRDASIAGMAPRLTQNLRYWIQYEAGYQSGLMPDILRDLPKQTISIVPAGDGIGMAGTSLKEQYGSSLRLLFVMCGLLLGIACANVANLMLARAAAQRRQTALRLAIGAPRRRIVAAALTESVLLAAAGGLAGLAVAAGAARLLVAVAFRGAQFTPIATAPSLMVLAFAAAVSLATGVVFGAAPAWFATRTDPIEALRGAGRSSSHQSGFRTALLVVQAALSVVLVAGAAMLSQSLVNLERQDLGYRVGGRVLISLNSLPSSTYTPGQLSSLDREIERRLANLPGVQGVGLATYNPLTWNSTERVFVAGQPPKAIDESTVASDLVSPEYLQDLGVTLLRGRFFNTADSETTASVAVVNESFVKRFFEDDEDSIGQHFGVKVPENAGRYLIVGVVRDSRFSFSGLAKPLRPMFFAPLAQTVSVFPQGIVLVTGTPPGDLEPVARRTLAEVDPNLTITSMRTIQEQLDYLLNQERAVVSLAELFGMVALVLAAVGIYGVTAYMVAQQTNEIGIRMALGADRTRVIQLVVRGAFQRVAMGLVVGLPLAVGVARFMAAQLYGVSFWNPFALGIAAGSLAGCAFLAAIIPAGRAASISPMSALRTE